MKIINIVPGFGGTFYCGNCLRDSAFVASLQKAGHDAVILPVYLPLTQNALNHPQETPVFYGAVNIYLKQQFPILKRMPGWVENLLNSSAVLKFASSKAGSTRAEGMEALTESMLLGMEGNQSHELEQLVHYLKHHEKPDVVHFSNALLLGMAHQIREEVGVPVVCSLQDEDVWVDAMHPQYQDQMWKLIAEKAKDVDAFIAVSKFFGEVMKEKLKIPGEKLHVVHIGIDPQRYEFGLPAFNPRAIGYLSRICEENGFGIVADAFIQLKKDPQFSDLRLKVTGGSTGDDKRFIHKQWKKFKTSGIENSVEFIDDFSMNGLKSFFRSITVLSVPVLKGEAFGLYQIEALASGIPIIQPQIGAFPEIINATGGGLLYHPNTPSELAKTLSKTLSDPDLLNKKSLSGRREVENQFDCNKLTIQMTKIYHQLASSPVDELTSSPIH